MDNKCSRCKETKNAVEFYKNAARPSGLDQCCKPCSKTIKKRKRTTDKLWIDCITDVPCMDCGIRFEPECMEFDHRDPQEKLFNISTYIHINRTRLVAEIRKCDIVCANCHKSRHQRQRQLARTSELVDISAA